MSDSDQITIREARGLQKNFLVHAKEWMRINDLVPLVVIAGEREGTAIQTLTPSGHGPAEVLLLSVYQLAMMDEAFAVSLVRTVSAVIRKMNEGGEKEKT